MAPYKILIVDDQPELLQMMAGLLRNRGFEVLEATDGSQAMDLLREGDIDLTIVDIFMPNVDGVEFTIRAKRVFPEAKIIVMSGGGVLDKRKALEVARSLGAAQTLAKPFRMAELLAAAYEVMGLPDPTPAPGHDEEPAE